MINSVERRLYINSIETFQLSQHPNSMQFTCKDAHKLLFNNTYSPQSKQTRLLFRRLTDCPTDNTFKTYGP